MLLPKLGGSWLLPPRDFPHLNESHPMDHDSDSSGHTITKAWHVVRVALFLNSVKEVEKSLGTLNVSERKQLTEIHDAV